MKSHVRPVPLWMAACIGLWITIGAAGRGLGQSDRLRGPILLPPSFGATPLSSVIDAQARTVAAQGDFLESAAIARKIHANAYAQELQNAVEEVKAYFERRRVNFEHIKHIAPDKIREERQKAMERYVRNELHERLGPEGSARLLNWLLAELCGPKMAVQYMGGSEGLPELNERLSDDVKEQIWLTDGGPAGRRLEFRLSDAKALETAWPPGLCREPFAPLRAEFETARDELLRQVESAGAVTEATRNRLILATNHLLIKLEEAFPEEARKGASLFSEYHAAKKYLNSLAVQVYRAASTNDRAAFTGTLRFQGNTILELIQHLSQSGLEFAPYKEGGERVYGRLDRAFRHAYLRPIAQRPLAPASSLADRK